MVAQRVALYLFTPNANEGVGKTRKAQCTPFCKLREESKGIP